MPKSAKPSNKNQERFISLVREGNFHLNQGNYRAAVLCYDSALELNSESSKIWDNREWLFQGPEELPMHWNLLR